MASMLPFFVYGTLKPGEENYPRYLAGRTCHEQSANIAHAALYTEGRYPFLVVGSGLVQPAEQVMGILITLRPGHYYPAMRYIDGLEEYEAGNPHNWYERIVYPIQTDTGIVQAWVYVAGPRTMQAIRAGRFKKIAEGVWSRPYSRP